MAQITYIAPIKSVSGKLGKKDKVMYMVRRAATSNAKMIANPCYSATCGVRSTPYSAAEIAHQTRFGKIAKGVLTRLNDPSQKAKDMAAYKAQREYKTLRQYVWHAVSDTIE